MQHLIINYPTCCFVENYNPDFHICEGMNEVSLAAIISHSENPLFKDCDNLDDNLIYDGKTNIIKLKELSIISGHRSFCQLVNKDTNFDMLENSYNNIIELKLENILSNSKVHFLYDNNILEEYNIDDLFDLSNDENYYENLNRLVIQFISRYYFSKNHIKSAKY